MTQGMTKVEYIGIGAVVGFGILYLGLILGINLGKAKSVEMKDINHDGIEDVVVTNVRNDKIPFLGFKRYDKIKYLSSEDIINKEKLRLEEIKEEINRE